MNRVVIKQNQFKTLWLLLLACIMTAVCIWLFQTTRSLFYFLVGVFGSLFFIAGLLYILYRFLKPKDILIINSDGFIDTSSFVSVGFVPWSNVSSIYIRRVKHKKLICITLHNTEAVLSNVPAYKGHSINSNISLGYAPIMIGLDFASENIETVFPIMKEYHEASLTSRQRMHKEYTAL